MANAVVNKIEFNQKLKDKFDGAYLYATTDKGQKKKEFIFQKSDIFKVLSEISVGDEVELKYVQNGDYWNLSAIKPLGTKSSGGGQSVIPTSSAPSAPAKSSGGYQPRYCDSEAYVKHKDLMIIRQSTMKAATDLVVAMLNKDMFKKTATADFLVEEVSRLASKLEGQVTGEAALKDLSSSIETLDTTGKLEYDADNPFPE